MDEPSRRLRRAAKQLIDTDRELGGDWLARGEPLPAGPAGEEVPPAPPAPARDGGEARRKAAELRAIDLDEVRQCTRCKLAGGRTNTVFGEGNPDADIVFVGEGPGAEEDKQGRPFVGRAGELLAKMIAAMGLDRQDVFICNVIKCRPPGNRAPATDEVDACWDYLLRQLRIIRPKVIVSLGNPATHALLNTTVGITRLRGQWQSLPMLDPDLAGTKVMPTFHPAFLLRSYNKDTRGKVWSDLQEVMRELGMPGASRQP